MTELLLRTGTPAIVVDTGASWLDLFASHPHPVIVLDHHQYDGAPFPPSLPPHVAFVDPLNWAVDGMTELCASTLAWLFTVFLDARNWDNASFGISGAISDRQHVGGFKGLNAQLVDEAKSRSLVAKAAGPPLFGSTVQEALARSVDPFVKGVSGHPEEAQALLKSLHIEQTRSPAEIEPEEMNRLVDALSARLSKQGVRPEFVEALHQEGLVVPSLGMRTEELANLQNATGRLGEPGVGVAIALGDTSAIARARDAEESWRKGVLAGLLRLEQGGVYSLKTIQWFESPDTTLAGTQAGLAMNYLLDPNKPVFAFTRARDGLKCSARGTLWLVSRGLDLALVCRTAAGQVGGEGGGHRVASGATVAEARRDEFLAAADALVAAQLHPVPETAIA